MASDRARQQRPARARRPAGPAIARVVFFTGKGGVGKTTTAAATAAHAATRGARVLVVSADPAHSLGDVLGVRLGPDPTSVASTTPRAADSGNAGAAPVIDAPAIDALEVDARAEMERHWGSIRSYLGALFRHQGIEPAIADELALLPGVEELAALLAVEAHARSGAYDLVVVDCAPTGATLRLVSLPEIATRGLRIALRMQRALAATVSPLARAVLSIPVPDAEVFRDLEALLYERLAAIRALLLDPVTTVRLVATPERMVIDEAVRAHTDLCLFELACDAVVMNRLLPPEAAAEPHFAEWARVAEERVAEVQTLFPGLPVLRGPLARDEVIGIDALAAHGARLFGALDPAARLANPPRLRFARRADASGHFRIDLPLPHASREHLDVAKLDDALLIRTGAWRRAIPLPRRLARLSLHSARLDAGQLVVRLAPAAAADAGT
jgi:arsenite-transporting ATPase